MATKNAEQLDEQSQGLAQAAGLIALVFLIGVIGYLIIGGPEHTLLDAFYMTVITLTTVGYSETIDLTHSPGGRLFTSGLLVLGVGTFAYSFSKLTAFMVEGNLARILWRRRMRRSISELQNHYIICGAGSIGRHMIRELIATERAFVLVDLDETRARELQDELKNKFPCVIGDATDDEVLREAGIMTATGVCAGISDDKDNLLITMTANMIRPELRIVARCNDPHLHDKLRRAGADAVVSPEIIGGLRLVSEMIRPDAVNFLDVMLRDKAQRLRIEEVQLEPGAKAIGRSIDALRSDRIAGALIIAIREGETDNWTFNPADEFVLAAGHRIVLMAGPEARKAAEQLWR